MRAQGTCRHCGQPFDLSESYGGTLRYCSKDCHDKDCVEESDFAKRLHDGTRLQSDDFGEEPGDDQVTYQ